MYEYNEHENYGGVEGIIFNTRDYMDKEKFPVNAFDCGKFKISFLKVFAVFHNNDKESEDDDDQELIEHICDWKQVDNKLIIDYGRITELTNNKLFRGFYIQADIILVRQMS